MKRVRQRLDGIEDGERVRRRRNGFEDGETGSRMAKRVRQRLEGFAMTGSRGLATARGFNEGRWARTAGRDLGIKAEPLGSAFYFTQPVCRL